MPKFNYIALDSRGQESTGMIDAPSSNDAVGQLRQAGYFPTSVIEEGKGKAVAKASKKVAKTIKEGSAAKKKGAGGIVLWEKKTVKGKILMIFTRQLATLIDAGLPLLRSLTVLAKQERDPVLHKTINSIADAVQSGSTFSESMAQHPMIFNKLYINMIKAGELGGVLELVLNRLAEFSEKAQKVKNKVLAAMAYPVIVLIIAILIMAFLMAFIVPKFEQIFKDMLNGKPLPGITVFVINVSNTIQHMFIPPDLWYTIGITVGSIIFWKMLSASKSGRALIDNTKLKLPLFGDLLRKSAISRFSRTLGTLVTSGVPILQALNITRDTAGNVMIATAVTKVHDAVKEGESIVHPLEASGVFPPMVISMVDVGEETGQLPEMLLKIAEVYDDEVDNAVEGLTSLLEPIMIVILALLVGTIVIALFMPLIDIIKTMGQQSGGGN
jgi:type IV pilus assembly protein PilC